MTLRLLPDPPPTADELEVLRAFRTLRAYFAGGTTSAPAIFTSNASDVSSTGHTKRVLDDACRAQALRGTKVSRGWRIERSDLATWEAERAGRRREGNTPHVARQATSADSLLTAAARADLDQISERRKRGRRAR